MIVAILLMLPALICVFDAAVLLSQGPGFIVPVLLFYLPSLSALIHGIQLTSAPIQPPPPDVGNRSRKKEPLLPNWTTTMKQPPSAETENTMVLVSVWWKALYRVAWTLVTLVHTLLALMTVWSVPCIVQSSRPQCSCLWCVPFAWLGLQETAIAGTLLWLFVKFPDAFLFWRATK